MFPQGSAGQAQQNIYPAPPQPREIGYLDRLYGVGNGLQEIESRLRNFADRLDGGGAKQGGCDEPTPAGITGNLSKCERHVRAVLDLLSAVEHAF